MHQAAYALYYTSFIFNFGRSPRSSPLIFRRFSTAILSTSLTRSVLEWNYLPNELRSSFCNKESFQRELDIIKSSLWRSEVARALYVCTGRCHYRY